MADRNDKKINQDSDESVTEKVKDFLTGDNEEEDKKRRREQDDFDGKEDKGKVENVGQPGVDHGTSEWSVTEKNR